MLRMESPPSAKKLSCDADLRRRASTLAQMRASASSTSVRGAT